MFPSSNISHIRWSVLILLSTVMCLLETTIYLLYIYMYIFFHRCENQFTIITFFSQLSIFGGLPTAFPLEVTIHVKRNCLPKLFSGTFLQIVPPKNYFIRLSRLENCFPQRVYRQTEIRRNFFLSGIFLFPKNLSAEKLQFFCS